VRVLSGCVVRGRPNPRFKTFPARLGRARKAAGLSFASLAEASGLTSATVHALENGNNLPRIDTVEKLAHALNLSPCLLAFGLDAPQSADGRALCAEFSLRLREARDACGLSMREAARRTETSPTLISSAEAGDTMPNLAKLEALAKGLGVSACWLAFGVGPRELPQRPSRSAAAQSAAAASR